MEFFLGTIISDLAVWGYSYPKYVYKNLFNRRYIDYIKETIGYLLLFVGIATLTYKCTLLFDNINNLPFRFIVNIMICIIVPNIIMIAIFKKTANFEYFARLTMNILKDKFKRKRNNKLM